MRWLCPVFFILPVLGRTPALGSSMGGSAELLPQSRRGRVATCHLRGWGVASHPESTPREHYVPTSASWAESGVHGVIAGSSYESPVRGSLSPDPACDRSFRGAVRLPGARCPGRSAGPAGAGGFRRQGGA